MDVGWGWNGYYVRHNMLWLHGKEVSESDIEKLGKYAIYNANWHDIALHKRFTETWPDKKEETLNNRYIHLREVSGYSDSKLISCFYGNMRMIINIFICVLIVYKYNIMRVIIALRWEVNKTGPGRCSRNQTNIFYKHISKLLLLIV
jgi:hypothetical protein